MNMRACFITTSILRRKLKKKEKNDMTLYGILGARYHDEVLSQVFVKNKIIKLYAN